MEKIKPIDLVLIIFALIYATITLIIII